MEIKRLENTKYEVNDRTSYYRNMRDAKNAIRYIESRDDPLARAGTSSAGGSFQFVEGTIGPTKKRLKRFGVDTEILDAISDDPTEWTKDQSELMFIGNFYRVAPRQPNISFIVPGEKDRRESSGAGTDELLHRITTERDLAALVELYYVYHMRLKVNPEDYGPKDKPGLWGEDLLRNVRNLQRRFRK